MVKNPVLVLQSKLHVATIQKWVKQKLNSYMEKCPHWATHYLQKTRIVTKTPERWRTKIVNVQQQCKNYKSADFTSDANSTVRKEAWYGRDMFKLPLNLNFPSIADGHLDWTITRRQCMTWTKRLQMTNNELD